MTDKSAIIVKPSTAQAFETLWKRGRVLFFSAPCGFGKTVLADTLLDGRPVLRLNAADTGFALPSLEDAWDILLIDNIQDMQEERDWQALRGQEQRGDRGDPEHPGLHGQEPCEQRAQ